MKGSFNLYWYSKESYNACKGMINETNHRHLEVINAWLLLVCVMYSVFSALSIFGVTPRNMVTFIILSVICAAYQLWLIFGKSWTLRHTTFVAYLHTVLMLIIGIYNSECNKFSTATLYPVLLTIVALSYISSVFKMTAGVVVFSGIFFYELLNFFAIYEKLFTLNHAAAPQNADQKKHSKPPLIIIAVPEAINDQVKGFCIKDIKLFSELAHITEVIKPIGFIIFL